MGMTMKKESQNSVKDPWAPAQGGLIQVMGKAQNELQKPANTVDTGYLKDMQARLDAMSRGSGDVSANQIKNEASKYMDSGYIDSLKQMNKESIDQTLAGQDVNSAASGNMGSSRAGLAAGTAVAQGNKNLNNQMLDYYNQQIDRASGTLESNKARQNNALNSLYSVQGENAQIDYNNQDAVWAQLQKALNIMGGVGGLGGSASASGSSSGISTK